MATEHAIEVEDPQLRRRVVRAGWAWLILAPTLFVVFAKAVALGGADKMRSWLGFALLGVEAAGLLPAALVYMRGRRAGVARCDERGLTIVRGGAEKRIPTASIRNAILGREEGAGRLELRLLAEEVLILHFETIRHAREALDALQLPDERRSEQVAVYSAASQSRGKLGGGALGALISVVPIMFLVLGLGAPGALLGALLMAAFAWGGISMARKLLPHATLGADGLTFSTSSDTTSRFVSYGDLDHFGLTRRNLRKMPDAILLELVDKSGKRVEIGYFDKSEQELASSILERLTESAAQRRARAHEAVAPMTDLEANGDPVSDWLARLQELARRDDSYRTEGIDDARIDALVDDSAAPKEQRIGAAMLLRIRNPDEGRDRIRDASAACADPQTRDALLAVAETEADEEALARAARHLG